MSQPPRGQGPPGGRPPLPPQQPAHPPPPIQPGAPGAPGYGAQSRQGAWVPPQAGTAAPAPYMMPRPRPRRGALKFVAHSCVASAWITLFASLILAVFMLISAQNVPMTAAPAPLPQSPVYSGGFSTSGDLVDESLGSMPGLSAPPNPGQALMGLLPSPGTIFKGALIGSAAVTLFSGVILFFLFLGIGQACYALIDLEQRQFDLQDLLQQVLSRQGR